MNLYTLFNLLVISTLFSCTYSINMVHTQGKASDVVDEQQDASPTTDANLEIPLLK